MSDAHMEIEHEETNNWVRGFLAGVAFCETNGYDKPLEMQQRAREYHDNVPMLLHDVWIPAGLGYSQGWITPLEHDQSGSGVRIVSNIGDRQKQILEYLREHGESTTQELVAHTGKSRKTVSKSVVALENRGLVESRPNPTSPNGKLRSLAGEQ